MPYAKSHNDGSTVSPRRTIRTIGRYQLVRLLGEGAMGRVYLASDPELMRDVAIKVLRLDQAGNARDAYIARFRNEARAAARFNHPNVVAVYDAGVCSLLGPYLVYEYIPGSTLRVVLDKGRLDAAALLRIARGVASALDALHNARIVHRDVKPDNILLAPDGRVKITDFGIARVPDVALTRDGQFLGTPAYAAPEAIARGEYSHQGDLFSFAAVLYEAFLGVRPFPGDDAVSVSYAVVNDTPKAPSEHDPSLSPAVDAVFARALSKVTEERFSSACDFIDALTAALQPARPMVPAPSVARVAPARRSSPVRPVVPPRRSYAPMVFAALLIAGVGVIAARRLGAVRADNVVTAARSSAQPQLATVSANGVRLGQRPRPRRPAAPAQHR